MKLPVIALVGSPNVGKSTIFNRIAKEKISIIEDTPGVTRDRIYATCEHKNYKFHLIDTGGIELENKDFNKEIKMQAELAIDEADVIMFIVDGKIGITKNDLVVKDMLQKSKKPVIVLINKADAKETKENIYDFYELGFNHYLEVSGEHSYGFFDALDIAVSYFKDEKDKNENEEILKFCIIGKPNAGKSSLLNAIVNEEKSIVSSIEGTTRDALDTPFTYNGERYIAIDTAGIRRSGKVYEKIEKYSVLRAMKAMDRSDVAVIVLDAESGITNQDKHIAGYAIESNCAIVIVVNKWDTIDKDEMTIKKFEAEVRNNFKFLSFANIVYLSALTKKRMHTLMPEILKAYENYTKEIKTSMINEVISEAVLLNPPPSHKGKRLKVYFCHQESNKPPKFKIQVNNKSLMHFSYERYLENKIRENIDFTGSPIILNFKNKRD